MKKLGRKILSCILVTTMISLMLVTSVFASDTILLKSCGINVTTETMTMAKSIDEKISSMNYEELREYLIKNFNATSEEATELAQYQIQYKLLSTVRSTGFPSNPNIGDVYWGDPITIHVAVDASVATLASVIISAFSTTGALISLGQALAIAGAVLSLGSAVFGSTVKITPSYTYGYNNDGVLGWTPGYMKYEIV